LKKTLSLLLAVILLLSCMLITPQTVSAAEKKNESRAIAIVFDNSGSMYMNGRMWWSQAIYSMEVFASMLNDGDVLQIYPMWPIDVNGQEYSMEKPYTVNSKEEAHAIREIHTKYPNDTPIETIDCAATGVAKLSQDKKYMIVLTDGTDFYENGKTLGSGEPTRKKLDARFDQYANENLTVMYLGIGQDVTMPAKAESEYFVKRQAADSKNVLSTLTEMCNIIFVRDTMKEEIGGKKYLDKTNKTIYTDVSLKKVIVFVQGKGISDLKLSGAGLGTMDGSPIAVQHPKARSNDRYKDCVTDTDLAGMMVTYTDCSVGESGESTYNIEFSGTATSIEVYYEPDVDMSFIFTDGFGNKVNPNDALYEGDYMVSYGMKDGKTGQLVNSPLLGSTKYSGNCTITKADGTTDPRTINTDKSGVEKVSLKMNDTFDAELTVTYLNGYTITKRSVDFGWPEGGLKIVPRPAGDLRLEITGGPQGAIDLQEVEESEPFIVKVFFKDQQLTGEELKKVEPLKWSADFSNAGLEEIRDADDHIKLKLHYKDPAVPKDTKPGKCEFFVSTSYTAEASETSVAQAQISYEIIDTAQPLQLRVMLNTNYYVISKLGESAPINVMFTMGDAPLTAEQYARLKDHIVVDCGGIDYELIYNDADSSVSIQFKNTEGIAKGKYNIKVSATYIDRIGREFPAEGSGAITLNNMALWLKWVIGLGILLVLILLIWWITHIRVYPSTVKEDAENCRLSINGRTVDDGTEFSANLSGSTLECKVDYSGESASISLSNLDPGKLSYLYKPSSGRSILVSHPESISPYGTITSADIDGNSYILNREGELVPRDEDPVAYTLTNDCTVRFAGKMLINGVDRSFTAEIQIAFKK